MLHIIKKAKYLSDYKIELHFDDKSVKIVDLGNLLKKAKNRFVPLRDIDYFKQVRCDGISIAWPNGVDLCPDVLYKMGKPISKSVRRVKSSRPRRLTRRKTASRIRA